VDRRRRRIVTIGSVRCDFRDVLDEDLAVLFEHWADPVAAQMATFTAPDHMDREAFERREAAGLPSKEP
jgi:hypothetical protein